MTVEEAWGTGADLKQAQRNMLRACAEELVEQIADGNIDASALYTAASYWMAIADGVEQVRK